LNRARQPLFRRVRQRVVQDLFQDGGQAFVAICRGLSHLARLQPWSCIVNRMTGIAG
jgi:hypothetical protein